MNIEKANSWINTLANVGVLIGILVVLYELNQNNTALRNDVAWSHTAVISELAISSAADPNIAEVVTEVQSWTDEERREKSRSGDPLTLRYSWYMTARVNYLQGRFLTETSDPDRQSLKTAFRLYVGSRASIRYWQDPLTQGILNSEFVEFGNPIVAELAEELGMPRYGCLE